ncbi:hypothetical protein pipiens_013739 [Culex pipiens pipiens]|uniref:Uncharacterized protein n=1 Tax=Culex pipiens pipiens TaxID=38569 RepID=A0ABD1CXB2_CULPP
MMPGNQPAVIGGEKCFCEPLHQSNFFRRMQVAVQLASTIYLDQKSPEVDDVPARTIPSVDVAPQHGRVRLWCPRGTHFPLNRMYRLDTGCDLKCLCLPEFSCELYSERMFGSSPDSTTTTTYIPILVAILIAATVGLCLIIKEMQLGKLSPAGNGRGINLPDMPSTRPPVGVIQAGSGVFHLDGQQNDGHKHPIIDTVQTVTTLMSTSVWHITS